MIKEAIILAGGLGTRLSGTIAAELPKCMAPVNGRPFLDYLLQYLDDLGLQRVILSVGNKHESVTENFGNTFGELHLEYAIEKEPLGTGGALRLAMQQVREPLVLVMNGDTFFEVDVPKLINAHRGREAMITMALHEVDDSSRYGSVIIDEERRITGFVEKKQTAAKGLINGGMYVINKRYFISKELLEKFSFEHDFLQKYYLTDRIFGLICRQYFIDIGIPADYKKAQDDFKEFNF
jgi:D-glycero-alpha-D-manno-heptose 1-phosphate guanylyltransferase